MALFAQLMQEAVRLAVPNGRLLNQWPLAGGISAQMSGLTVALPDGAQKKFVLRTHSSAALAHNPTLTQNEFRLLQLAAKQRLPVAQPYHFFAAGEPFATPAMLLHFVEGEMRFAHADPTAAARQMAEQLAAIHQIDATQHDLTFLPQQTAAFAASIRPRVGGEDVLGVEQQLLAKLQPISELPSQNKRVLLHGDFWPGNVLWQDARLAAVIDWEDAQMGEPLYDLAIARSDMVWILGIEALEAFTARYLTLNAIRTEHLPLWDLWATLRFIRLASEGLGWFADYFRDYGRSDITPASIRASYQYFIDQAWGKLG